MLKTAKWRLVFGLTILSLGSIIIGVVLQFYIVLLPAIFALYLAIGVMAFGDKKQKKYKILLIEGLLWNLL